MLTVTDAAWLPPVPVQVNVNVVLAFRPVTVSVPLTARTPLQPPDAEHVVACEADHVSATEPPTLTVAVAAVNVTTGAGGGPLTVRPSVL
jgi:hypothetical protein